jgi:hypothetical protein
MLGRSTAFLLLASMAAAAQAPRPTFVIRRDADTVAVERFNRDGDALTGEVRQKNGVVITYVMILKTGGGVALVDLTRTGPAGNTITAGADFKGNQVLTAVSAGGQTEGETIEAAEHPVPFLAVSFAICEQIVRATHLKPGQTTKVLALRLGVGDTATATVARFHADSVSITMPDITMKLALNAKGEVVGGRNSNQPWTVERR